MKSKEADISRKNGLKNIFSKMILDVFLLRLTGCNLRSMMTEEPRSYADKHTCILYVAAVINAK